MIRNFLTCLIVAVVCVVNPARSEALLLADFWIDTGVQFGGLLGDGTIPPPTELSYIFGLDNGRPETSPFWEQMITAADLGQTLFAPPDIVSQFSEALQIPLVAVDMRINYETSAIFPADVLEELRGFPLYRANYHVPFNDMKVTSLSRTIEAFEITSDGKFWSYRGSQTVRIYGELVPEPASWIMLLFVCVYCQVLRPHHPAVV